MTILSVNDPAFAPYGRVIAGYDTAVLLNTLCEKTPKPERGTMYEPSVPALEALPIAKELSARFYGGMPVQLGCCNGRNTVLNCLEYHRDSELNIPADDMIFLVATATDIKDDKLDTAAVKAFSAKAGAVVELYATTLHYAPCSADGQMGFRVAVVLPRGTNLAKPEIECKNEEDRMLFAANKWLLAHPDAPEAKNGAYVGLIGENIDIADFLLLRNKNDLGGRAPCRGAWPKK